MDLRYITALGGFSTYSHSFPQEKNTMCKYFAQYTYILRSHIYSKIYIYIQVPRIYLTCFSDGGHENISNQNFQKNVTCNLKMRQKLWKMYWRTSLMLKLGRWKQKNQNLQGTVLVPMFFGVVVGFFWTYFYIWNTLHWPYLSFTPRSHAAVSLGEFISPNFRCPQCRCRHPPQGRALVTAKVYLDKTRQQPSVCFITPRARAGLGSGLSCSLGSPDLMHSSPPVNSGEVSCSHLHLIDMIPPWDNSHQ